MALFGGSSTPTFNAQPLINTAQQGAQRQKDIVNGLYSQLPGLSKNFETSMGAAGTNFQNANTAAANAYSQGLKGMANLDQNTINSTMDTAKRAAYANLPAQQNQIRESLAATGNLRGGRGGTALAAPAIQTASSLRDLAGKLQTQAFQNQSDRTAAGLNALYTTAQGNALTQLGIDQNTAQTLLQNGRGDLINQAASLVGIDQNELNAILGLQETQQMSDIAAGQSANERRLALGGALGTLAGTGIGAYFGGLPGARVGGMVGQAGGDLIS